MAGASRCSSARPVRAVDPRGTRSSSCSLAPAPRRSSLAPARACCSPFTWPVHRRCALRSPWAFSARLGSKSSGNPVAAALSPVVGRSLAAFLGFAFVFAAMAGAVGYAVARWGRATERPHLGVAEIRNAGFGGASALGFAVVLLFEAWMIGAVCRDLATADYLVALLSGWFPPVLLPLLLFATASAVSFATGSSWSTMSILLPNVVGLAASLGEQTQLGVIGMVAISIGAVLDGAIFGDHCSPISDTTVLSSVASGSDHLDHVRTQAPYAFATADPGGDVRLSALRAVGLVELSPRARVWGGVRRGVALLAWAAGFQTPRRTADRSVACPGPISSIILHN